MMVVVLCVYVVTCGTCVRVIGRVCIWDMHVGTREAWVGVWSEGVSTWDMCITGWYMCVCDWDMYISVRDM